jgi:hypothetical protein
MTNTIPFEGKLLILGCGAVSRCVLPLLLKHIEMPPNRITVLDVGLRRPTLDDVFLALTGHVAEPDAPDGKVDDPRIGVDEERLALEEEPA